MEKRCERCGLEILDYDYLVKKYPYTPPKYCEACRREIRPDRRKSDVERKHIKTYSNVLINIAQDLMPRFEKAKGDNDKNEYIILSTGGREYGKEYTHWAGAKYDKKELWFIPKSLKNKIDDMIIANIRAMEKIDRKGNIYRYYVIEKSESSKPERQLIRLNHYHKTTLKGYGKDRNYHESIREEDLDRVEFLTSYKNNSRSGRFGYKAEFYIAPMDIVVMSEGVE